MRIGAANSLLGRLGNELQKDLQQETDETQALRQVVIHCILLLQEAEDVESQNFCRWLLMEFHPIASHFQEHKQKYLNDVEVLRARTHKGTTTVLLPEGVCPRGGLTA